MGTSFGITLYAPNPAAAAAAAEAAFKRIAQLEDILSDYQADSELNLLRGQPVGKPIPVSRDLFAVLDRSERISRAAAGAFDVTIGPFVRQWRFARKRGVLPTPAELDQARASVGWQKLRLDRRAQTVTLLAPGMQLDSGGIAKGYAADEALRLCKDRGLARALVAASGDIAIGDPPPGQRGWKIAIASMDGTSNQVARTVCLKNAGISTSGDTEQFIEINGVRYSHIVNPATGLGLTERIQATVIARNAATSDALATTACILGSRGIRPVLRKFPGTSALICEKEDNGAIETTVIGWPSEPACPP